MKFISSIQYNIVWFLVIFSLAAAGFIGFQYFAQAKKIESLEQQVQVQRVNQRVVNFLSLFIEKVLKSEQEISFEDRLRLENAIRDINDPELLAKWQRFTAGTTEQEIQNGVKDLLESLADKMVY